MVHFAPAGTDMGSQEFAQIFMREIFRLHGLPQSIVTDRDTCFTSEFFKQVCKLLGVRQCMSTAYHPESDGQTERANRTLEDMLRHFVSPAQDDWDVQLSCCEFAVNNAWNHATESTPFFLNFGNNPWSPVNVDIVCKLPAADTFVGRVREAVARTREYLESAQKRMTKAASGHRRDVSFDVGEWALLSTKHLKLSPVGTKKLLPKYLGPFEVVRRIGKVAYELNLPASMTRYHDVFHVRLLKNYMDGGRQAAPPPAVLLDGETEQEIEQVLTHADKRNGRREYYVSWKGQGPEENCWLADTELANAADVVQDYSDSLQQQGRPAACVGRPPKQPAKSAKGKDKAAGARRGPGRPRKKSGGPGKYES